MQNLIADRTLNETRLASEQAVAAPKAAYEETLKTVCFAGRAPADGEK
jgi:hypothetical protein